MLNVKRINEYCCEDITLIENYEQAVNDTEMWDCHHRLETDLGLSVNELIDRNLYYNRPASELIFMTHSEHIRLHQSERMKDPNKRKKCGLSGEKNPMYGKNAEDYMSEEAIKEKRKKLSIAFKGENNPMYGKNRSGKNNPMYGKYGEKSSTYGRTWMNNGIVCVYPKTQEEIEHYRSLGYHFGRKLNNYITKNIT